MATTKERITEIINRQPDECSYDEIIREPAFDLMVQRGMKDSDDHWLNFQRRNAASDTDLAEINWTRESEIWLQGYCLAHTINLANLSVGMFPPVRMPTTFFPRKSSLTVGLLPRSF